MYRNDGDGQFTDVTDQAGVANALGRGRSVNWVDVDNDGHLDLFVENLQTANVLYRNSRDRTFTNVALSAGIAKARGIVSSWADYDKDGDMDLYVSAVSPTEGNTLWRNNGDDTFREVTLSAGLKRLRHGGGIAWGDYNNDGYLDLYITRRYADGSDSLAWNASMISFNDVESDEEDGLDFITSATQGTFDLYLGDCRTPNQIFIGSGKRSPMEIPFTITASDAFGTSHARILP